MSKFKKIYCYVDESGQDTKGKLFVVSIVVSDKDRDLFQKKIEKAEKESKKGKLKWGRSNKASKIDYLKMIITNFKNGSNLRYSVFKNTKDFDLATIVAISKAIHYKKDADKYKSVIYIDALPKSKRPEYARELRKLGIYTQKIRQVVKDENNPIIRLADSVAGWVRDVIEENDVDLKEMFDKAVKNKTLIEV